MESNGTERVREELEYRRRVVMFVIYTALVFAVSFAGGYLTGVGR